jgi:hypothetical protein
MLRHGAAHADDDEIGMADADDQRHVVDDAAVPVVEPVHAGPARPLVEQMADDIQLVFADARGAHADRAHLARSHDAVSSSVRSIAS